MSIQKRIKTLETHGLTVERTRNGHLKVTIGGQGPAVFASGTPGKARSNENLRATIKRILNIDVKGL